MKGWVFTGFQSAQNTLKMKNDFPFLTVVRFDSIKTAHFSEKNRKKFEKKNLSGLSLIQNFISSLSCFKIQKNETTTSISKEQHFYSGASVL